MLDENVAYSLDSQTDQLLSILQEICQKKILDQENWQSMKYFGHIDRRRGDCLEKVIRHGKLKEPDYQVALGAELDWANTTKHLQYSCWLN